jgi:hypothetical protein
MPNLLKLAREWHLAGFSEGVADANGEHEDITSAASVRAEAAFREALDRHDANVLRAAAGAIQSLHPGEEKASVVFLTERADVIERGETP